VHLSVLSLPSVKFPYFQYPSRTFFPSVMFWSFDTRTVPDIVHTFIQIFGTGAGSVSLPLMGWEGGLVGGWGGGAEHIFLQVHAS
jgi:hypothetical protein